MSPSPPSALAVSAPPVRPVLRGWLHATTTPAAVAAAVLLWRQTPAQPSARVSVLVFGSTLVGLYAVSSTYHLGTHVGRWGMRARRILGRLDVAMIQLFIAGTFTPVAFWTLDGSWRTWSLVVAWTVAIGGAAVAASPLQAPRWVGTLGFIAVGWLAVVPFTRIVGALQWQASALILLGGVLYTVGAVIYAARRPDPFPAWFGYHELFHLLVVAGSTAHYIAIWRYVVPLA